MRYHVWVAVRRCSNKKCRLEYAHSGPCDCRQHYGTGSKRDRKLKRQGGRRSVPIARTLSNPRYRARTEPDERAQASKQACKLPIREDD